VSRSAIVIAVFGVMAVLVPAASVAAARTAAAPSPREGGEMAFDAATGQIVLFGGEGSGSSFDNETWT
jgi:hypothetical protein